jgi:hypothetical protein
MVHLTNPTEKDLHNLQFGDVTFFEDRSRQLKEPENHINSVSRTIEEMPKFIFRQTRGMWNEFSPELYARNKERLQEIIEAYYQRLEEYGITQYQEESREKKQGRRLMMVMIRLMLY